MAPTSTTIAEQLHRLPEPQPLLDPAARPFVGNESADDNLAESAQVAMWGAIGRGGHDVTVTAEAGVVKLTGRLPTAAARDAATQAIEALVGIGSVDCAIEVEGSGETTAAALAKRTAKEIAPEPFVHVVRYCSLDEASLSAAIRQAVDELDALFVTHRLAPPARLYVVYRNRRTDTVTVEIGMPAASGPAMQTHTVRAGYAPSGLTLAGPAKPGVEAMLAAVATLTAKAKKSGYIAADFWWQSFEAGQFRPWNGHPAATVLLPVHRAPATSPSRKRWRPQPDSLPAPSVSVRE